MAKLYFKKLLFCGLLFFGVLAVGFLNFQNSDAQLEFLPPEFYVDAVSNADVIFTGTVMSREPLQTPGLHMVNFQIDEITLGNYTDTLSLVAMEQYPWNEIGPKRSFFIGEQYYVIAQLHDKDTLPNDQLEHDFLGASTHWQWAHESIVIPISSESYQGNFDEKCNVESHLQCLEECSSNNRGAPYCIHFCFRNHVDHCQMKNQSSKFFPLSPLKQTNLGTPYMGVICDDGLELIVHPTASYPSCVKHSSVAKLIERGWSYGNFVDNVIHGYEETKEVDAGKKGIFSIRYNIHHAEIDEIFEADDAPSLLVKLKNSQSGSLIISIPRDLLDAKINELDDDFFVLVDGKEVEFDEKRYHEERVLRLYFNEGTKEIEIIAPFLT